MYFVFQTSQPSSSVRIRDNQRRSRARRKEYIDDLEQRLRRFERLGVEATTEVQAAARKVAKENTLLRSLLVTHGVPNSEIDDYLRGKIYNSDIILPHLKAPILAPLAGTTSKIPNAGTREPKIRAPNSPYSIGCGQVCQPGVETPGLPKESHFNSNLALPSLEEADFRSAGSRSLSCCTHGCGTAAQANPKLDRVNPSVLAEVDGEASLVKSGRDIDQLFMPLAAEAPNNQLRMDDETTCEDAANIIASMRGHGDAEAVRSELGCPPNVSCTVKNMAIFKLLDA